MMGRSLLLLVGAVLLLAAQSRPIDTDFKPVLTQDGRITSYQPDEEGLLSPIGVDERPGSRAAIAQAANLIQESHSSFGDEDIIGGQGKVEEHMSAPRKIIPPMAALLQEDESKTEPNALVQVPCDECTLHKIEVPHDFSGDLNALAEQAYEPDESMRREAEATSTPADDDDTPQMLKYHMRPGDELVGGIGRQDSNAVDAVQVNLETGEGISTLPSHSVNTNDNEVHIVKHKTEVLMKDVLAKDQEVMHLKQVVAQLQQAKDDRAASIKSMREADDKRMDELKKTEDEKLAQLQSQYEKAVEELKSGVSTRMQRIKEEQHHIGERKIGSQQQANNKEREELSQKLTLAMNNLQQLEQQTLETEKRAEKLTHTESDKFEITSAETAQGNTIRARFTASRDELLKLHRMLDDEESVIGELGAKIREEQHAKLLLDTRLKNLHMREETVMVREKNMEVANANLRHELDKEEYDSENTVEMVTKAREALKGSAQQASDEAQSQAALKERLFEAETMQAAQDEISRLKADLARKERKEAHIGQTLLEQEKKIQVETSQATEVTEQTQHDLKVAEEDVKAQIEEAQQVAKAIVEEANRQAPAIEDRIKQQTLEGSQKEIAHIEEEQKLEAVKLMEEEKQTKTVGQELREKMKQQMEQQEKALKDKLQAEEKELQEKLQREIAPQLENVKKESEAHLNDINADWVMAKIHADKSEKELAELKQQEIFLQREVEQLKQDLKHQHDEWIFQQAVASSAAQE
eukprot:c17883_g1_i1.p1 GENE.c17883_g1_i1~~c17883_g1_i1.p1  ORF type:complete len:753 (-),score=242.49 c17883_g1_i1:101-2359(-)